MNLFKSPHLNTTLCGLSLGQSSQGFTFAVKVRSIHALFFEQSANSHIYFASSNSLPTAIFILHRNSAWPGLSSFTR